MLERIVRVVSKLFPVIGVILLIEAVLVGIGVREQDIVTQVANITSLGLFFLFGEVTYEMQ